MSPEELAAWFERQPVLKVLKHVGYHSGDTSVATARIACRRAADHIQELEATLAAYDRLARRLMREER